MNRKLVAVLAVIAFFVVMSAGLLWNYYNTANKSSIGQNNSKDGNNVLPQEMGKIKLELLNISKLPEGIAFYLKLKNGSPYLIKQNSVYVGFQIKAGQSSYMSNKCKSEADGNKLNIASGEEVTLNAFIPAANYTDNLIDITRPFYEIKGYINKVENENQFSEGGGIDVRKFSDILTKEKVLDTLK